MKNMLPALKSTVQQVGGVAMPSLGGSSPETSTSYSRSNTVENNTYAPQFNLTISGTGDDRSTARKVKQWIDEALDDRFTTMSNKNRRLREV